jgi:hypothetical protein
VGIRAQFFHIATARTFEAVEPYAITDLREQKESGPDIHDVSSDGRGLKSTRESDEPLVAHRIHEPGGALCGHFKLQQPL